MNIDVEKLKGSLRELNELIEEYENVYYGLYNELSNCSTFWGDNKAALFFDSVNAEKLEVRRAIDELNDVAGLYGYLVNKYNEFGSKVNFDSNLKNEILVKFDSYLKYIYDILDDYRRLNVGFDRSVANSVYNEIDKLVDVSNILVDIKSKIKKYFNSFEEIEKEINLRISKININILKESEINDLVG